MSLIFSIYSNLFFLLTISIIFDPLEYFFKGKTVAFLLLIFFSLSKIFKIKIPINLILYNFIFIFIPLISIFFYYILGGNTIRYDGLLMLKGYVFILISIAIFFFNIKSYNIFILCLNILAISIVVIFVILEFYPDSFNTIYIFGVKTGIISIDNRNYGSGIVITQIYFVTSPLLVFNYAHYFYKFFNDKFLISTFFLLIISFLAIWISGTRSQFLLLYLIPFFMFFIVFKNKYLIFFRIIFLIISIFFLYEIFLIFIEANEYSNKIKINLLSDYSRFFSNPRTLIFGDGLGSYVYWDAKGFHSQLSELTFLELFRNFGMFGGLIFLGMIFVPFYLYNQKNNLKNKSIAYAYLAFLISNFFNPNLLNSIGVLVISILISDYFLNKYKNAY